MTFGELQKMNEAPAPVGEDAPKKKTKKAVSDEAVKATEVAVRSAKAASDASPAPKKKAKKASTE